MNDASDYSIFANELAALSKTGFFRVNLCDHSTKANEQWYKAFGAMPGLTIYETLKGRQYIHPVDNYTVKTFLMNVMKGYEKDFQGYVRVRVPGIDTMWRWFHTCITLSRYEPDNNIIEVVGMNHDVTALVDTDDKQKIDFSRMTDFLTSFNTIPWAIDFRTNTIVANRMYISKEYVFDDTVGVMSFDELLDIILPEYRPTIKTIRDRIVNGQIIRDNAEIQMRFGKNKQPVWVDFCMIAQEYDHNHTVTSGIGTCTVIQKRKMAELAMQDAQFRAERASMVKSTFLASVSHELRTPLNAILGFSTVMAHSDVLEERMQCLGAIQSSGSQLLQIIDNMLAYAAAQSGCTALKHDTINLYRILQRAVEEAKPQRMPGVEMTFCSDETELIVHGDAEKISYVAMHLLGNAAKYTTKGNITLILTKSNDIAIVEVKDTGMGMNQEALKHIFESFYKADTYVPGLGLGLSLVQSFVKMWGGSIKVDSKENRGTTITFTIPLHNESQNLIYDGI